MKKQITILMSLVFMFSGMSACNKKTQEPAIKGVESRLKYTKKDAIQTIMARKAANIEYMMYGFINFDEYKITKATNNIIEITEFIKDKMPRRRLLNQGIWDDLRGKQIKIAKDLAAAFKKEDYKASREYFKQLVANCMSCHELIKHQ